MSVRLSVHHQNPKTALNHSFHLTTTFTTHHTIINTITTQHHKSTQHSITTQHHNTTSPNNITLLHTQQNTHHRKQHHNQIPHHHPSHLSLERLLSFSACLVLARCWDIGAKTQQVSIQKRTFSSVHPLNCSNFTFFAMPLPSWAVLEILCLCLHHFPDIQKLIHQGQRMVLMNSPGQCPHQC